ncbi:MAG TPA: tetratricopeptide repeat protein [Bacteroidia bacterium]|jgi:tetratricopeptide (TPR) repeat protein
MKCRFLPLIFLLLLSQGRVFAGTSDTAEIGALVKLFDDSINAGRMGQCEKFLKLAEDINRTAKSEYYNLVLHLRSSLFSYRQGNFQLAYELAEQAKALAEAQHEVRFEGEAFNYMGMNIARLGNSSQALGYYQKAIDLFERSLYDKGRINALTNIAGIYFDEGDFVLAISYFQKALDIAKQVHDEKQIGNLLNNIGSAYQNQGKEKEAKNYYLQAVQQNIQSGNDHALAYNYLNLSYIEMGDNNLQNATDYNEKAMNIFRRFTDRYSIVGCLCQRADILMQKKQFPQAISIFKEAITLSESTHSPLLIERTLKSAAAAYEETGDYKMASSLLNRFIDTKDSIVNEEIRNEVTKKQMRFEFDKKHLSDSLNRITSENNLKQEIASREHESRLQKFLLLLSLGILALIAVFAFFIYRSNQQSKKAGVIIRQQKEMAEQQRTAIETKNKEILDSIGYAKRLQEAILPRDSMVKKIFPDSFVFYRPKDIVAGDFYWMDAIDDTILFAVADCTGHGVPGAMVSVVCSNALDRAVKEFKLEDPGKILDKVSGFVSGTFSKSESEVMDGMDIALCAFKRDGNNFSLAFSGANNPVWIIRRKELIELEANKQPVGKFENLKPFTTHHFELKQGDLLFLFTDGYADQFGGPKGKKFKYRQLLNRIVAISGESMEWQKNALVNIFDEWKGELEQVDDVCLIGIRI